LRHTPLQQELPAGQGPQPTHIPPRQPWPERQRLPQAPQLLLSACRSTHASLQHICAAVQRAQGLSATQRPDWQTCPAAQRLPHEPQCSALVCVCTHASLQHWTLSPMHAGPAPHEGWHTNSTQRMPATQWALSVHATQRPLARSQRARPPEQSLSIVQRAALSWPVEASGWLSGVSTALSRAASNPADPSSRGVTTGGAHAALSKSESDSAVRQESASEVAMASTTIPLVNERAKRA
jgi:hypothetical protein